MLKSVYTTSVLQVCVIRDCVTHDVFPSRLGKKMQDWKMFPLLLGYSFSCSLLFVWWHDITKCQMKSNRKQMLMTFEWKKVCCVSVCYLCVLFCREEWDIVNLHSVCVSSCLCSHACILMLMLLARKGVCECFLCFLFLTDFFFLQCSCHFSLIPLIMFLYVSLCFFMLQFDVISTDIYSLRKRISFFSTWVSVVSSSSLSIVLWMSCWSEPDRQNWVVFQTQLFWLNLINPCSSL